MNGNQRSATDRQSFMRRIILLISLFAFVTACTSATEDEIDITGSLAARVGFG